jgi:photosystem II stability/assembly factor-like uncharacterized protein
MRQAVDNRAHRAVLISVIAAAFAFLLPDFLLAQALSPWDEVPEEIRTRNSFKRFEWFYRQRAFPFDTIQHSVYATELNREGARWLDRHSALTWSQIGPRSIVSTWPPQWGNMSGRVRAVAVHPTDPDFLYIGAASGGLWKTTNGGGVWAKLSEDFASNAFGAIAIDPQNPNIVYAGGGEAVQFSNTWIYPGRGLYKSTDGGSTWTQITNGFGDMTHFGALVVSPHNSSIVFAALGSGNTFLGTNLQNEGIWRSTDAGITWTRTLNVQDAFDIIPHPTDSSVVYAATGGATSTSGFHISTNNGSTWTTSNSGLPAASQIGRIQITLCRNSPAIMYAVIYGSSTTRAYKSTNGGASWGQISSGVQLGGTYNGTTWADQGWYDLTIAVHPINPDIVYIGNVELHRTTNGQDFLPVRSPTGPFGGTRAWDSPMHTDYHKIVFSESNPNTIYAGGDGGIYRSTDGGVTWPSINTLISSIQYYRISSHPTNPDIVIGGAQDNGNYRTADRGATPWAIVTTGDGMESFFDHTNPNNVYMSTQNGNLLKSISGGLYGTFSGISPPWESTPNWITPYFMHPTNNQIIYAASRRFWRSTNAGSNWVAISPSITTNAIHTVSQSRVNHDMFILAAGGTSNQNPQVMVSDDGGSSWRNVSIPGPARYISRVVTHPHNAQMVFAVRSGFGSGKVYVSADFGDTWTNISGDLPDIPHNDLFIDPLRPYDYYVANDFGVYLTTNGGTTWTPKSTGMPIVPVLDFDYFHSNGTRLLRAGTHGRSAFESPLSPDTAASIFVSPTLADFGKLEVGAGRDSIELTISNFGLSSLTVHSVSSSHPAFVLVNLPSFPATIPGSGSLSFRIVFDPIDHGPAVDSVVITSSDASNPSVTILLSGRGIVIGRAQPGIMYATSFGSPSGQLYSLNPSTGEATAIGELDVVELQGLAIRPTNMELHGVLTSGIGTSFYRVSSGFGDVLPFTTVGIPNMRAIAFAADDSLYGATTTGRLYRINLATGDTTFIGTSGLNYSGLSFSPTSGLLWASVRPPITNRDHIYTVSTGTGQAIFIGATGDNAITPSIAFGPDGTLFGLKGISSQTNTLIVIDTLTAAGTLIGATNVSGLLAITMRMDSTVVSVPEPHAGGVPQELALLQNYPNPFNPATRITFVVGTYGQTSLRVYDLLGREVATLVNELKSPGEYTVTWDGKSEDGLQMSSGVYFYRLVVEQEQRSFTSVRKLMLMR